MQCFSEKKTSSIFGKPFFSRGAFWSAAVLFAIAATGAFFAHAETTEEKQQSIQAQIDALEKEAEGIDQNIQATRKDAENLKDGISILNGEIKKREIEILKLSLSVRQAELDIQERNKNITITEEKIGDQKKLLASSLMSLNDYESEGMFKMFVKNKTVSAFLLSIDSLYSLQKTVKGLIVDLRDRGEELKKQKDDLVDYQASQENLKGLQAVEKRFLAQKKKERDQILALTKGKEAVYQQILAKKKKSISELRTQLFYLTKTGVSAEDALKYANLAAERTGIRPAFLLAILEVETGKQFEDGVISVGTNLGTGNWKRDMYDCYVSLGRRSAAESQKRAFFAITAGLGFDPDRMPVSRRYGNGAGCGGAMGPAQFIPTTWLLYANEVASLTGHKPPNPWNIEDAFTASASFLADGGATSQTKTGEVRAARIYISGKATCSTTTPAGRLCNYYANRVYSLSLDIDKVI
ncbi:MAG: hypothetical protein UX72_C0043G0002 [Parcubacteria group bacterium GW2011_GWA2_47_10]|nr:MAG: hypothetical protein UX72_C0043G0002 [Parcubacteria group bacterium GW2011_GWA2_47_10]